MKTHPSADLSQLPVPDIGQRQMKNAHEMGILQISAL